MTSSHSSCIQLATTIALFERECCHQLLHDYVAVTFFIWQQFATIVVVVLCFCMPLANLTQRAATEAQEWQIKFAA